MNEIAAVEVPARSTVPESDCWDLKRLFPGHEEWEAAFELFESRIAEVEAFRGTLAESPERLLACLVFESELSMLSERLGYYAMLRTTEDTGDSEAQARKARFDAVASRFQAAISWKDPEILAIPDADISAWLEREDFADYRISLSRLLRFKPHMLGDEEERLLALQAESRQTPSKAFSALTDVDMEFGEVDSPEGRQVLTHGSYYALMEHRDRDVRRSAWTQFMSQFAAHRNTLTALLSGSVLQDIYQARVRNFGSALERGLFDENVPVSVYENLIAAVHEFLPALHRYYALRARCLKLDALHLYDTKVPVVSDVTIRHTYDEAVERIIESLKSLGDEYTDTLREGLCGSWVDRYENKGKYSGAFSAGSYHGEPYILMNYHEEVLNEVFTLTHEAGHSMHSWYSVRNNPYPHYDYTIFVAEVASTFNEQFLMQDFYERCGDDRDLRAYLLNRELDQIIGTIFRQTMFAEFEKIIHEMVERNEPLTVDSLGGLYRKLMEQYFGPSVELDEHAEWECLRIPHLYSAFYVYKYATGMAAAMVLARKVREGEPGALERYLEFLKSGGSRFPLEQLDAAGVDMTSPEPVREALQVFEQRLSELETLLDD